MNIKELLEKANQYPLLWLAFIFLIGFVIAVISFISNIYFYKLNEQQLCFTHVCLRGFAKATYLHPFLIMSETIKIIVSVATVGGIYLALKTYLANLNNSKLANHISHFSIFNNYIADELTRYTSIKKSSISVLAWYNFIFDKSRDGSLEISDQYIQFVNSLNIEIDASNAMARQAKGGFFRYVEHQTRIQEVFDIISVGIERMPRNDFYEVEDQVFQLVRNVNKTFCYSAHIPEIHKRLYL